MGMFATTTYFVVIAIWVTVLSTIIYFMCAIRRLWHHAGVFLLYSASIL